MVIALLLLTFVAAIQQDPPKENKPPKRGDVVIAKGCVKGGMLETVELSGPGDTKTDFVDLVTFRLTGDKKKLQEIKKEHDGHADLVTGELRTDLPRSSDSGGKKIGNTRVTFGVGDRRGIMQPQPPPMPVLKVNSLEHTGVSCR